MCLVFMMMMMIVFREVMDHCIENRSYHIYESFASLIMNDMVAPHFLWLVMKNLLKKSCKGLSLGILCIGYSIWGSGNMGFGFRISNRIQTIFLGE